MLRALWIVAKEVELVAGRIISTHDDELRHLGRDELRAGQVGVVIGSRVEEARELEWFSN